jgi:imidazole glycerol phosphate synthase glutamine amidotransferase subunit
MIGVVDYGMSNLGSVMNALAFVGAPARLIERGEDLTGVERLLVPGQGAFGDCMAGLRARGFERPLLEWIAADRPFLGICMGLQLLFESSEEAPGVTGLAAFPGRITRFTSAALKIPQMGWNRVAWAVPTPLAEGIPDGSHFYFVHSYHAPRTGAAWESGVTDYGVNYVSAVSRGRVHAVQFHPEKSQALGLRLLRNFLARG